MMMMMPSAALRNANILFLFILILLGSAHTTAGAAVVAGGNATVVADSHSSLTSMSLVDDYSSSPASSTTVPGGSHNNDAVSSSSSSSSSSIYDHEERDEYVYNICINCHVFFDMRIVITEATNNDDDDDEPYSSASNNDGRKKSTSSTTPRPDHESDNFAPRGSTRMPMPSIRWRVMLHEILPADAAAANGGNGATPLLPLANAIAHPHLVADAPSSSSSSSSSEDQQRAHHHHRHNHTLSARIVVPYSSFVDGGDKRAKMMTTMMMRETVVVASLIREEDDPNNNNNTRIIIDRSLINVVIPPNPDVKGSSILRRGGGKIIMSSSYYYNTIDPIYTTILEDSVPFVDVDDDNNVIQTNDDDDDYNSSIEQDVTNNVVEKMENYYRSSIIEPVTATSFEKHEYHTTVLRACAYVIFGMSVVLIFVLSVSFSFNDDDEVDDDDDDNNNSHCHYDVMTKGTPEAYSHNNDGEYIGPRDYSSRDNDGHRTAMEQETKEDTVLTYLLCSSLDCQSPGSIVALPNSNSPSMLDEMTNYVEGDHEQRIADEFHLAKSLTNSMLPRAKKSYDHNHNILLGVFGTSKFDKESTENVDGESITEEDKVPSHDDDSASSLEDDVNENVSTGYVAESSSAPVQGEEVESQKQFPLSSYYNEVDRTTSAGVNSEIDVNGMSFVGKLHTNDDDDAEAHDDNEYEANEGKVGLPLPPKIRRITTVDSPCSVPFDPVNTCYSPTAEVARCIPQLCNERETIMEHGHELQQTSSRFESGVEDAQDIDMSEDDVHNDAKQSSPRDSSNHSVSSSAITVRAHNSNCGVKRSAAEFHNSEDGSTSSNLSTSITSVQTSDKRQRRQPTAIPARVSTSPTFAPALRESDVGNKENHSSTNYILGSNEILFGSNDDDSSAGYDSPSLISSLWLEPLTEELSVDDTADRFPSPSSTVAATDHEFADPRRNKAVMYDHPIPIPSGGVGQSKRFGISSTRTSSSISYPDQRFEQEPSDSLESNQVDDHARRKRAKQRTRKIESKLRAAMKRVINVKPSSALNDLSQRVEESAWQFSSDEIQINRRNFANDATSEKSY